MRDGPDSRTLAGVTRWETRVESWLGGDLLADDVPVAGGVWAEDSTQQVPEALRGLTVPPAARSVSWVPDIDPGHPLAKHGQQLAVTVRVSDASGRSSWTIPLGRAAIQSWSADDPGDVVVDAVGLLQLAADERLPSPTVPTPGGTFATEFQRLMPAGVGVDLDDAPTDRPVPAGFEWDEDRLAALYDLTDAWPALIAPDGTGGVRVIPPLPDTPDPALTFTDGAGGTVVSAPRSDTREGTYNAVVARAASDDPDAPLVQAEAQATAGAYAIDTYGIVRRFYSSPLLTTQAQCLAAAQSLLASSLRPARTLTVTCVRDPRVELYDPVRAIRGGRVYDGYVIAYELPLTVQGGDMTITVGLA